MGEKTYLHHYNSPLFRRRNPADALPAAAESANAPSPSGPLIPGASSPRRASLTWMRSVCGSASAPTAPPSMARSAGKHPWRRMDAGVPLKAPVSGAPGPDQGG